MNRKMNRITNASNEPYTEIFGAMARVHCAWDEMRESPRNRGPAIKTAATCVKMQHLYLGASPLPAACVAWDSLATAAAATGYRYRYLGGVPMACRAWQH